MAHEAGRAYRGALRREAFRHSRRRPSPRSSSGSRSASSCSIVLVARIAIAAHRLDHRGTSRPRRRRSGGGEPPQGAGRRGGRRVRQGACRCARQRAGGRRAKLATGSTPRRTNGARCWKASSTPNWLPPSSRSRRRKVRPWSTCAGLRSRLRARLSPPDRRDPAGRGGRRRGRRRAQHAFRPSQERALDFFVGRIFYGKPVSTPHQERGRFRKTPGAKDACRLKPNSGLP